VKYQFEYEDRDARSEGCHAGTEKPTAASVAVVAALPPQARIRSFQAAIGSSWLVASGVASVPVANGIARAGQPPLYDLLAKAPPQAFAWGNGWAQS